MDEDLKAKWALVQGSYEERYDIIPHLTYAAKITGRHEKDILEEVIRSRGQIPGARFQSLNNVEEFEEAQSQVTQALSRLIQETEKRPEMKTDPIFQKVKSRLEQVEQKILESKTQYNAAVLDYNSRLRRFPDTFFVLIRRFYLRSYLKLDSSNANISKYDN